MTRKHLRNYLRFFILVFLVQSIFSCNSTKKIKYFQDIRDSGQVKNIPKVDYLPITIRTGDILNISIQTMNPTSSSMINSGNLTAVGPSSAPGGTGSSGILAALSGGNQNQQQITGFLVDEDGFIEMPLLGKFKAAGYTTDQLKAIVAGLAAKYFKDMTVVVRLTNFKVSVIGEVLKPGQYIMPAEKESIMDAITMAGDLTIFGKRENVLLIRENLDGTKTTYRLNLKNSDILSSPLYYLRQNDLIYVEPRKAKSDANDAAQARYAGIIGAILSVLIIFASRLK
ncbi:polysaccharide biosynthesis/export family protein [Mucilaginibacter sp.]|uniref:polysaccharide biosynthesis/export family protein n=1 Tax=Mucilaginibacter sp. TaxID=1882438 RepID=UPI00284CF7BA|nr:polysaccharide biosynthesis/export family protein [Mucilaginibacter sp.]MDR3696344.1 polysaccharide biosynthesis/export family protein [Mucilaginibacter sp.]